ncbi:MAG: choice-of-anchor D domain-containing protein [Pseudomonadota bacterium]
MQWRRGTALVSLLTILGLARCDCGTELTEIPTPDIEVMDPETGTRNDQSPVFITFGDVQPGATLTKKVQIRNAGTAPLVIQGYGLLVDSGDSHCPAPSAEFELQPAPQQFNPEEQKQLNIVYVPRDGGEDCAILRIASNDPDEAEVRVYLTGRGAAPKLCVSTSQVDFGEVNINTHETRDVTLSNCGTQPLTLQTLTPQRSFPPFSIDTAPTLPHGPLAPGDTVIVTFGFESATTGDFSDPSSSAGFLQIDAVGPINPTSFLVLTAVAITPPACDLDAVPRSVQLGHVRPGQSRSYDVALINRGRLECSLQSITRTAGSTDFTITAGGAPPARTIAAGGQSTVTFQFAPSQSALANATFTVASDDPAEATFDIQLEGDGTIPSGCFIEPDPLSLNFGTASTSQTTNLSVVLNNIGDEVCLVRKAEISQGAPDFFVGNIGFPIIGAIVPAGDSLSVPVSFKPVSEGPKTGRLRIEFKEQGFGTPTQNAYVDLVGNGSAPQICVDPSLLDFGTVNTGQRPCAPVAVSNCGQTELNLRGVVLQSGSSQAFEVTPPAGLPGALQPGQSINVQVCYRPDDMGGDLGAIEIISDDPDDNTTVVLLRGNASGLCPPFLACEPDTLDMGDIPSDQPATRTVICTNYGTEVVSISSVAVSPAPPFAVSAVQPAVLGPGDQLAVQVTFGPGYVGAFTAQVSIHSNACHPIINVDVTVAGVEPNLPPCIPPRTFSPQTLWRWDGSAVESAADQVWVTPMVANMNDDNGDGLVDVNDIPDVIFNSFDGAEFRSNTNLQNDNGDHMNDPIRSYLRIVSGDDGHEIVSVGGEQYAMDSEVNMAVADIDGDNLPEVVGGKWLVLEGTEILSGGPKLNGKFKYGYLIAFEHDGTFKWVSEEWRGSEDDMENSGAVSIADVDKDGFPEILFGHNLFDRNGHLLWTGTEGSANSGHGPQTFAVNLDGQGPMEIVAGRTVYRSDGSVLWNRDDIYDGNPIVIDVDVNGTPELVLRNDQLHILNALTGATVAGPFDIPNPNPETDENGNASGVIPTIPAAADFDGDGRPEIVVANQSAVVVFEADGTVLWMADIYDGSGMAGPSAFDFEGDGHYEVVYADESKAWAFSTVGGSPGFLKIYEADRSSRTIAEIATVADINNDGRAEMVVVFNEPMLHSAKGVTAFTNSEGAWIGTRRVYNQQAYHVTNIDESGVVPRDEPRHWTQGVDSNSFHANVPRCAP